MKYDVFVKEIVKALQEQLGTDYEVKVTEVVKNNNVHLTGVVLIKKEGNVSPTIYLEQLYKEYQEGADFQEIVWEIITLYRDRIQEVQVDMEFFTDFKTVKDKIYYRLVHYDKNKAQMPELPHIRWKDLAVTFYVGMEENIIGRASITVRNEHMKMWKQNVDSLLQISRKNMQRDMPELLVPMKELLEEMTGLNLQSSYKVSMYVLTNKEKLFGASAILYSEKMKELAELLGCDLLILPSSVHEVLLLPDDHEKEYGFYRQMVSEVNMTQVEPEEILSDSLYRYNRQKAEIEEIIS